MLQKLRSFKKLINMITEKILIVTISIMVIVVLLQVIFRYLLNNALPWPEELARFLMVWIAMIGASVAWRRKQHIGVIFLMKRLPLSMQRLINQFWLFIISIFLFVLVIRGFEMAWFVRKQVSPALQLSMFWAYIAIPVGSIFLFTEVWDDLLGEISHKLKGQQGGESQ